MLTTTHEVRFKNGNRGIRQVQVKPRMPPGPPKVPHVSRLTAFALRCDELIQTGVIKDQTGLAELANVTRGRLSQFTSLLNLSPDIQAEILFFPPQESRNQSITEPTLRPIAVEMNWERQREMWNSALANAASQPAASKADLIQ